MLEECGRRCRRGGGVCSSHITRYKQIRAKYGWWTVPVIVFNTYTLTPPPSPPRPSLLLLALHGLTPSSHTPSHHPPHCPCFSLSFSLLSSMLSLHDQILGSPDFSPKARLASPKTRLDLPKTILALPKTSLTFHLIQAWLYPNVVAYRTNPTLEAQDITCFRLHILRPRDIHKKVVGRCSPLFFFIFQLVKALKDIDSLSFLYTYRCVVLGNTVHR